MVSLEASTGHASSAALLAASLQTSTLAQPIYQAIYTYVFINTHIYLSLEAEVGYLGFLCRREHPAPSSRKVVAWTVFRTWWGGVYIVYIDQGHLGSSGELSIYLFIYLVKCICILYICKDV